MSGRCLPANHAQNLDEVEEVGSEDIKELSQAADLSLSATKEIGHSMAALVATERHLWLNLSDMKEKDRFFLIVSVPGSAFWPCRPTQYILSSRGFRRVKSREQ